MTTTSAPPEQVTPTAPGSTTPIEPKRRFSISRLDLAGRPLVTISAKAAS